MKDLSKDQQREIASARRLHEAGAIPADLREIFDKEVVQAVLKEAAYKPIICREN